MAIIFLNYIVGTLGTHTHTHTYSLYIYTHIHNGYK